MIISSFNGFFDGFLSDARIEKRVEKVMDDMLTFGKVVVNKFCATNTEKIGAYRMFGNKSFNFEHLSLGVISACRNNQGSPHLLCLQDTTEVNFTHHIKSIGTDDKDIGPITKNDNAGFFCHPMLVVDAEQIMPIGISYVHLWNRSWNKKDKYERDYSNQGIQEKESYRWIESAQHTKDVLSETPMLTIIGDRESDIYEEMVCVPDHRTHLLIRSSINRKLTGTDQKLFEFLEQQEQKAEYEIELKGNKKRKNRIAKMSLKYSKVQIQKPSKKSLDDYPKYCEIWAIEAREFQETVPEGEEPVLWRLLTTHELQEPEDALKCTEWYACRWLIEELFRIIKSEGLEIESSQLETGAALKKMVVIALQVALVTMMLKLSLKNEAPFKAELIFTPQQIQFIGLLIKQLEGKTERQQNPYAKESLAWCAWGMARLSGWSGYKSHGPPGYITLKNGLDIFYNRYEGYLLAFNNVTIKDVYKE